MFREIAIWVYMRLVSGFFFLATLALAGLGLTKAASDVELLRSGVRVQGVVVEMREKVPAPLSTPAPVAKPVAAPVETAKPGTTPASAPPRSPGAPVAVDAKKSESGNAEAKSCSPMQAPVVKYRDQAGTDRTYESTAFTCPPMYKRDQAVVMLVDPQRPERRMIDIGTLGALFWPLVMAGIAALFGVATWMVRPKPAALAKLLEDPPVGDEKAVVALADFRKQIGMAEPPGSLPLQGIVASSDLIAKGEVPLDLCELCAYMAALAYERIREDGVDTSTIRVADYLQDQRNFPWHNGASPFRHVEVFSGGSTEGFGFVLDGAAFIILRGTMGWADWKGNLDAWPTGEKDLLPPGMESAPPRHPGFTKGWAAIRNDVQAWIDKAPSKADMPFVISGHSLGGALSFLAAWELASQGRKIAAVITFGAALPGTQAFAEDYKTRLGLYQRTLQLEFTQDIVPEAQKLIGYLPVGHVWEPRQLPFISHRAAMAALPVTWLVGSLQSGLVPGSKKANEPDKAAAAKGDAKPAPADTRTLQQRARSWVRRLIMFAAFSSVLALAAHKMQKRYGLALSVMSYRKIRERRLAEQRRAAPAVTHLGEPELASCYDELCTHLRAVRGSTPDKPGPFTTIPGLPRRLASPTDLRWFNAFFAARSW